MFFSINIFFALSSHFKPKNLKFPKAVSNSFIFMSYYWDFYSNPIRSSTNCLPIQFKTDCDFCVIAYRRIKIFTATCFNFVFHTDWVAQLLKINIAINNACKMLHKAYIRSSKLKLFSGAFNVNMNIYL